LCSMKYFSRWSRNSLDFFSFFNMRPWDNAATGSWLFPQRAVQDWCQCTALDDLIWFHHCTLEHLCIQYSLGFLDFPAWSQFSCCCLIGWYIAVGLLAVVATHWDHTIGWDVSRMNERWRRRPNGGQVETRIQSEESASE
jgi:hypothetical protein